MIAQFKINNYHYGICLRKEFAVKTIYVDLSSINNIKMLVSIVSRYDGDFNLVQGEHIVDAKSIVGIFSLDISVPIQLVMELENRSVEAELEFLTLY